MARTSFDGKPCRASALIPNGGTVTTNEMPATGQPAPNFTLPATGPETISLSDFRGKHVVLAFYVLDFTGG